MTTHHRPSPTTIHHPPGTIRQVPDTVEDQDLECRSIKRPGTKDQEQRTKGPGPQDQDQEHITSGQMVENDWG